MTEQKGNLKQQAAAERLHNAMTEFYLSVIEQVQASMEGKPYVEPFVMLQSYNIFIQSVEHLLNGWTSFWTEHMGKITVNVTPDRIAFKDKTRI